MNHDHAWELVENQIAGPRFEHTKGVAAAAVQLAEQYGAKPDKAELAAIFHDYAKLKPISEMKEIILGEAMDARLLDYNPELWHGPAGMVLAAREGGVTDQDILLAIRYHTTGRAGMGLLEKIVYLADYIEPGRSFPGVEEVRALARENLDAALVRALGNTISFLISKGQPVFPDTFEAYNDVLLNIKGGHAR